MTPADPRRIRRVSDAVVASYIHDISARTGSGTTPAPARRHSARADQRAHTRRALRRREDFNHARRDYQAV
jgi:GTP cyclohydrolase III